MECLQPKRRRMTDEMAIYVYVLKVKITFLTCWYAAT